MAVAADDFQSLVDQSLEYGEVEEGPECSFPAAVRQGVACWVEHPGAALAAGEEEVLVVRAGGEVLKVEVGQAAD